MKTSSKPEPSPPEVPSYIAIPENLDHIANDTTVGRAAVLSENMRVEAGILADSAQMGVDWLDARAASEKVLHPKEREFMSRHDRAKLGELAVAYRDEAEYLGVYTEHELIKVRSFFSNMAPEKRTRADKQLDEMGLSGSIFGAWKEKIDPDKKMGWTEVIGTHFTNAQLMNFLQANVSETAKAQAELDEQLPDQIRDFKLRVKKAVSKGWLPSSAIENLDQLENVEFFAGDIFETIAQKGSGFFHPRGSLQGDKIVISAERLRSPRESLQILTHEMLHAISGTDGEKAGLRYRGANTWLDEAMTEHATQILVGGQPANDAYPYSKSRDGTGRLLRRGTYIDERELLSVLNDVLPISELMDMYFGTDQKPLNKTLAAMVAMVGMDEYKALMSEYNGADTRAQAVSVMRRLRIKAGKAVVSQKGRVPEHTS